MKNDFVKPEWKRNHEMEMNLQRRDMIYVLNLKIVRSVTVYYDYESHDTIMRR